MDSSTTLQRLRSEMQTELVDGILPYWMTRTVDERRGGFVGRVTHDEVPVCDAEKGGILNARILWSFAAAYRVLGDDAYRRMADRAYDYLHAHFLDDEHGGIYWMTDAEGHPTADHKHVYAQSFAIYALSEYHRTTDEETARDSAIELYRLVEQHCADARYGGYVEACTRDWHPLDDVRLSSLDDDAPKSMNTHLHVLEAYTALYRIWPDDGLRERLAALVDLFLGTIFDTETHHLILFFGEDWTPQSVAVSFGHDIEACWLLVEAANVLEDDALRERVCEAALATSRATLAEGLDDDGGLFNERKGDHLDADKHWWPQAEAIVGFLDAYQHSGDTAFLDAAAATWAFVRRHVVDHVGGEWFETVACDGRPYAGLDKVRAWKGPYHNTRACLEVMERAEKLLAARSDGPHRCLPRQVGLGHPERNEGSLS